VYAASDGQNDLLSDTVCICDDDNDIEMAMACSHAFIPSLHSSSMEDTVRKNPSKFTKTFQHESEMTKASEEALKLILAQL
jgi:hypothetical protein